MGKARYGPIGLSWNNIHFAENIYLPFEEHKNDLQARAATNSCAKQISAIPLTNKKNGGILNPTM